MAPSPIGIVPLGNVTGAQAFNAAQGNLITMTLTGDVVGSVSNVRPGASLYLKVSQDATGGHALTFASGGGVQGITSRAIVDPAPAQLGAAVTWYEIKGTTDAETTAEIVNVQSVSNDGKVCMVPNGTDDTAQIAAVLQAGLVGCLGPVDGTYKIDGTAMPVLIAEDSGGLIMAPGVTIQPTSGWAPAAGSADTRTNAFFQVAGVVGAYASTCPLVSMRGARSFTVAATAGFTLPGCVRVTGPNRQADDEANMSDGSSVVLGQLCEIATVASGTRFTVKNPLSVWIGNTVTPLTAVGLTPVRRFFIEGGQFDTLGRNIACAVCMTDCYGASTVNTVPAPDLHISGVQFKGFSRSFVDLLRCHNVVIEKCYSRGQSNGMVHGTAAHSNIIRDNSSSPDGVLVHPQGIPRPMVKLEFRSSDNVITGNRFYSCCSGIQTNGGINNQVTNNWVFNSNGDARLARDPDEGALICAIVVDTTVNDSTKFENAVGLIVDECHGINNFSGVAPGANAGVHSFCFRNSYQTVVGRVSAICTGPGNGTVIDAETFYACAGFHVGDGSGTAESVITTGMFYPFSTEDTLAPFHVGRFFFDGSPGQSGGTTGGGISLNNGGGNFNMPRFGTLSMVNYGAGGIIMGAGVVAAPDWYFTIRELIRRGGIQVFHNAMIANNPPAAVTAFAATEVAELDATAAAGTRTIVAAGAASTSPCVLAMGGAGDNEATSGMMLICPPRPGGQCSIKVSAAVANGVALETTGGAGHAAQTSAAPTARTCIGVCVLPTAGAGTSLVT